MTPHVRAKIRTRNRLLRTIHQNRQEWIDAYREATETINEAKTESWKNLLQGAMSNSDGPNMWKIIQGLNGTLDANSPNEAMSHNGRTIIDIKSKVNIFIKHYARVSKLNMSQAHRDINRQLKKHLNAPSVSNESCSPVQMAVVFVAKPTNSPLFCHPNFSTIKASTIFHLHHGSSIPLAKDEFPPLFLESLVELMT